VPAVVAALAGAFVLTRLSHLEPLGVYDLLGRRADVTVVKLVIAVVIGVFALLELWPRFEKVSFPPGLLTVGGVLSGSSGALWSPGGACGRRFFLRLRAYQGAVIATGW